MNKRGVSWWIAEQHWIYSIHGTLDIEGGTHQDDLTKLSITRSRTHGVASVRLITEKAVSDKEVIVPMASFLASDEASYITGANIPIDGGWTAF